MSCAIVTGGGSGIGLATARAFRRRGVEVVVIDLRLEGWERLTADDGGAVGIEGDAAQSGTAERAVEEAVGRFGGLGVLVNAAGVLRLAPALLTSEEDWDEVLRVNLRSVFLCSRAAARSMVERGKGGRIINISSIHAAISEPEAGAYTASKAAIEGYSRTLATELAPHRITVNCIRPGAIETAMSKPIYTPEVVASLSAKIPLGTIGQPEAIAAGVMYLASEEASYCTGTVLTIDGGYSMDGSLPGAKY